MGNIFKTLGIDDFFRDNVPLIGGGVANFLSGMDQPKTGKTEGRISNEDYQYHQDLLDSSNPREINRTNQFNTGVNQTNIDNQSAFLKGIAPAQAEGYNTYQNATYQADTDRQNDRILDQSKALGMSPWEITGSSGSAPLPSPSAPQQNPQQRNNNGAEFLSTMTPLAIAKMNNETSLKNTKMQTDTSKYIADQSTNKGQLPAAQTVQQAAQTVLTTMQTAQSSAQTNNINTDSALKENQMWLNSVSTLLNALPTINIDTGIFKSTEKDGWRQALQMLGKMDKSNITSALQRTVQTMPKPQFDQLTKDIIKLATMFSAGAKGAMNTVASLDGLFLTLKNMLK